MTKGKLLYEGKAKKVFETDDPNVLLVAYKDDATAFNGEKRGTIKDKGEVNNRVTNFLMRKLEQEGIPTHLVEEIAPRELKSATNFMWDRVLTLLEEARRED